MSSKVGLGIKGLKLAASVQKVSDKVSKSDKKRIIAQLIFAQFSLTFANTVLSPLLVLVKNSLTLDYSEAGFLIAAYSLGYSIGQIPWGYLADRFGSKALALSLFSTGVTSFLFGTSTSFYEASAWRIVNGFASAGIFVPTIRIIVSRFAESRGTAVGLSSLGSSIATILSPPVFSIVATVYDWRYSVYLSSVPSFIASLFVWFRLRNVAIKENSRSLPKAEQNLFTSREFWILGYGQFMRLGFQYALVGWLPTFLFEARGFEFIIAASTVSVLGTISLLGNPLGGFLADKLGHIKILVLSFVGLAVGCASLAFTTDPLLVWVIVVFLGMFIHTLRAPIFAILPDIFGIDRSGRVTGYQNTFASLGSLLLPFIFGVVRNTTGSFLNGWIMLAILVLSASFLTSAVKEKR